MRFETEQVAGLAVSRDVDHATSHDHGLEIVIVHGTMDRGAAFRRTARRVEAAAPVLFDRRGYAGSSHAGLATAIADQVDDLEVVVDHLAAPVTLVGHSLGGLLAMHLGVRRPDAIRSLGLWEPPLPWLDWYTGAVGERLMGMEGLESGDAADLFMRSMIGDRLWERLPEAQRAERREEGPALMADIALSRNGGEVDLGLVDRPTVVGHGTESPARFQRSVAHLVGELPDAVSFEIAGAAHGAHLSHPAEFARFVDVSVERGHVTPSA